MDLTTLWHLIESAGPVLGGVWFLSTRLESLRGEIKTLTSDVARHDSRPQERRCLVNVRFFSVFAIGGLIAIAGCALFNGVAQTADSQTAADIVRCQADGREAGTYASYNACMVEAGLTDGGVQ